MDDTFVRHSALGRIHLLSILKSMRRFCLQSLVFLLLQAGLLCLLLTNYNVSDETNYLAATVEKHIRLQKTSAPRVILLGGSNVALGFESDRMERELGRPVVNMGLAAGLGAEFMLAEIEPELKAGDTVVLSFEYDHFARGPNEGRYSELGFDPRIMQQVLIFRPSGMFDLGLIHFRKIILDRGLTILGEIARRGLTFRIESSPSTGLEQQSARRAFNAWGDFLGHRRAPPRATPEAIDAGHLVADIRGFPSPVLLSRIRNFVERSERKGTHVVFSFAPKPSGVMQREKHFALQLVEALRSIPGLPLLDTPEEQTYPPNQFYDTANHLTAEGAAARTTKVIDSLRPIVVKATKSVQPGSSHE